MRKWMDVLCMMFVVFTSGMLLLAFLSLFVNKHDVIIEPKTVDYTNLIISYDSATLKYNIDKTSKYYISYIWAKNAYKQMSVAIPQKFGTLATADKIINDEINSQNYQNKGLIAVNASAFISKQFGSSMLNYIPEWENSSVSPIVVNKGRVIRNLTLKDIRSSAYITYGLNNKSELIYYRFYGGRDKIQGNMITAQKMIAEGVKNTFAFSNVLVINGKAQTNTFENAHRNALCQFDKNNFAFITAYKNVTLPTFAKDLENLGCITAVNLDGGGSTSLAYKKADMEKVSRVYISTRPIVDVLYFVEQ